jgi:hypothetical protein
MRWDSSVRRVMWAAPAKAAAVFGLVAVLEVSTRDCGNIGVKLRGAGCERRLRTDDERQVAVLDRTASTRPARRPPFPATTSATSCPDETHASVRPARLDAGTFSIMPPFARELEYRLRDPEVRPRRVRARSAQQRSGMASDRLDVPGRDDLGVRPVRTEKSAVSCPGRCQSAVYLPWAGYHL